MTTSNYIFPTRLNSPYFTLFLIKDPKLCFEYIYNSVKDTPSESSLLSILQHLILIRDDFQIRSAYFHLIAECVARIALHKDGRDPDFDYTLKFDFDVESLLSTPLSPSPLPFKPPNLLIRCI